MMSSISKLRGIRSLYPISIYPHARQIFSFTHSRSLCSCTSKFPALFQEHKFSNGVSHLQRRQNSHIYSPEKSKTATRDPLEKQAALSSEPFLDGTSANYIDEMYEAYKKNPSSVHVVHLFIFCIHQLINYNQNKFISKILFPNQSWQIHFKLVDAGAKPGGAYQRPPPLVTENGSGGNKKSSEFVSSPPEPPVNVHELIRSHQVCNSLQNLFSYRFLIASYGKWQLPNNDKSKVCYDEIGIPIKNVYHMYKE